MNIFVGQFTEQLLQYGVKWMIVNLSSPSSGDWYLSPHSVLTQLNRGSTSKVVPVGEWGSEDAILDSLEDRYLFGEIMTGLDSMSVKVIAYMASEGPAMLETLESRADDLSM